MQQLRSLLDNTFTMSTNYPFVGAMASDDYFIPDQIFEAFIGDEHKSAYTWGLEHESADPANQWMANYRRISAANTVLDYIGEVSASGFSEIQQNALKGEALFYRAYTSLLLTQIYAMPYNRQTASAELGVPIKLSSDINEVISRPTLEQNFNQIIKDLKDAILFLPTAANPLLRPSRTAAEAALAQVYLIMADYENAFIYAEKALKTQPQLLDFNQLSLTAMNVIPLYNEEVIWHGELATAPLLNVSRMRIDSNLMSMFDSSDLRKYIFFKSAATETFTLKSAYNGYPNPGVLFCGLATDELYLIKAEALIRKGTYSEGLQVLNDLLIKRYDNTTFKPRSAGNKEDALVILLAERRKELCFRGMSRWIDIRRINSYDSQKITVRRKIGDRIFTLEPGSTHYAFLLPQEVIFHTGITQNKR